MNFNLIHESMHSVVPYRVTRSSASVFKAEADFDGKTTEYVASQEDDEMWEVSFRAKGVPVGQQSALTNDGNALKVFAFVIAATKEVIDTHAPAKLMFTADKDNGSVKRVRVYEKLISRMAAHQYTIEKEGAGNSVRFILTRK